MYLPPLGVLSEEDVARRASLSSSADLIGARVAYRPSLADAFVVLELQDLPLIRPTVGPAAGGSALVSLVDGLRFTTGPHHYEVRASALRGGTFALFDCSRGLPVCDKVADLGGGFGTTGKRIVFPIPLRYLEVTEGDHVSGMEAFTASCNWLRWATQPRGDLCWLRRITTGATWGKNLVGSFPNPISYLYPSMALDNRWAINH